MIQSRGKYMTMLTWNADTRDGLSTVHMFKSYDTSWCRQKLPFEKSQNYYVITEVLQDQCEQSETDLEMMTSDNVIWTRNDFCIQNPIGQYIFEAVLKTRNGFPGLLWLAGLIKPACELS